MHTFESDSFVWSRCGHVPERRLKSRVSLAKLYSVVFCCLFVVNKVPWTNVLRDDESSAG